MSDAVTAALSSADVELLCTLPRRFGNVTSDHAILRLEHDGLVQRIEPADREAPDVDLTAAGAVLLASLHNFIARARTEERGKLLTVVHEAKKRIRQLTPDPDDPRARIQEAQVGVLQSVEDTVLDLWGPSLGAAEKSGGS